LLPLRAPPRGRGGPRSPGADGAGGGAQGYVVKQQLLCASPRAGARAGCLVSGPLWNVRPGHYAAEFFLRARHADHSPLSSAPGPPLPPGELAAVSAWDCGAELPGADAAPRERIEHAGGRTGTRLAARALHAADFAAGGNSFTRVALRVEVASAANQLELRLVWRARAALDVAFLALRDA
jgi:hypothetical protein